MTKITAPPMPAAVLMFFDTPRNGQSPRNWLSTTLLISAVVSKVSQIGTPNGGVTVYNVTLTIVGDENLKFGMNGTATIRIE